MRRRIKHCTQCGQPAPVLYRVQYDDSKQWVFVCNACLSSIQDSPYYTYGGTWKADKRR